MPATYTRSATDPNRLIGATVRATNRTYGLAPARPAGEPETVARILDPYALLIETAEGNVYANGDFTIVRFNGEGFER